VIELSIDLDILDTQKHLHKVQKQVVNKAITRSLNRTLDQVRVVAARTIAKDMGMRVGAVKKRLKKIRARRGKFEAVIRPHHWTPNLIEFGARQLKKKGVSHKAWGKRSKTRGAFIGRGRTSGKRLVYSRTSDKRYPIKALYGPTLKNTFVKRRILKVMEQVAHGRWSRNFDADFKYYLSRVA